MKERSREREVSEPDPAPSLCCFLLLIAGMCVASHASRCSQTSRVRVIKSDLEPTGDVLSLNLWLIL